MEHAIWAQAAPNVVATGDGVVTPHRVEFEPPVYYIGHDQAGYAQHLRDALPKATFVAFTGTPVSSTDRDTRAVFGDYIHVYDMQQSKEDGATVAIRQIISSAVVSESVVDILDAVGLDKPNIGLLDDEFLAQVRDLPEKNLAVELLERLVQGEIKNRFARRKAGAERGRGEVLQRARS